MAFQMGSGILDFLVLAVLSSGDTYGYVLTQHAKEMMEISDSTLYPVLRRLQAGGLLTTYDQPYQGRNRRYYSITTQGIAVLETYKAEWNEFETKMNTILSAGGVNDDQK